MGRRLRVSIEGNIGVGKSSLVRLLQAHPRLQGVTEVFEEPISEWQNVSGTGLNMLEAFYKEPQRYAYLFQSFAFITRFLQHNAPSTNPESVVRLTERSVLSDRAIFVEAISEQGYFNKLELAAYDAWYNAVVDTLPNLVIDCFIYLRADPQICYDRLRKRGRSEEVQVDLKYLELIHKHHEMLFLHSVDCQTSFPDGRHRLLAGILDKGPNIHPSFKARPVLIVDYNFASEAGNVSVESLVIVDQIVDFLLKRLDHLKEET